MAWNSPSASFDYHYSGSISGTLDGGPFTVSALIRCTDTQWGLFEGLASGADQISAHMESSKWFTSGDFTGGFGGPNTSNWMHIGYSKPAGSAAVRWHAALHDGTSWGDYTDADGATIGDGSPIDTLVIGKGFRRAAGDQAAIAFYDADLGDAGFAALGTTSMADWMAASPFRAYQMNTDPAGGLIDLTGSGDDLTQQANLPGWDGVTDPPGWTYYDASPPEAHSGTAAATLALALAATGHKAAAGTGAARLQLALAAAGSKHATGTAALALQLLLAVPKPIAVGRLTSSLGGASLSTALSATGLSSVLSGARLDSSAD